MLGSSNAFDIIVDEIKLKTGIIPISIQRNKIYIYNENHLKKLFQVFSFICFKDENEKMMVLNHINSILFRDKSNVLKYKMNLHYATLNEKIFQSFLVVEVLLRFSKVSMVLKIFNMMCFQLKVLF